MMLFVPNWQAGRVTDMVELCMVVAFFGGDIEIV